MKQNQVELWVLISAIISAIFTFGAMFVLLRGNHVKRIILKSYENMFLRVKENNSGFFSYEKWERYLRIHGAAFHFGKWMNPVSYFVLCLLTCLALFVLGLSQSVLLSIGGALIGLMLPGLLVEYMDKRDNEEMLTDLNLLYSALSIQIRAGVYVTDALAECYSSVRQIRLKRALLQLSGDIVMKADLGKALLDFQNQFCNKYVDSLCITISQAMESGQAVELLGDIAQQIKDMEILTQNRKKQQLDRSITFYELGIFAAIICFVIFTCVQSLFQTDMFIH